MPLYEYECSECKGIVEKLQSIDAEAPVCCNKPMLKRPSFPSMFIMKGMGGYPSLRKAYQAGGRDIVHKNNYL